MDRKYNIFTVPGKEKDEYCQHGHVPFTMREINKFIYLLV